MHTATLYESLPRGVVRCTACKLRCVIKPGQAGVCGVRQNQNGKLYLLVYGRASAVNVDPVEKKPLYHFLPGTRIFSVGTVGCNFACAFCQNWSLSQVTRNLREQLKKEKRAKDIELAVTHLGYDLSPARILEICRERHIPSVAFTYNEPVIFFEYLYDTAVLAKKEGLRTVMVSNGYESEEALDALMPYLDAINVDLKSFRDEFYKKICKARLGPVLDTIQDLYRRGIWLEVTTLVIPGHNDSEEELKDIAGFIAGVDPDIPWHISAFFPAFRMKDVPPTPTSSLIRAYEIGKEAGLRHCYLGNVADGERSTTRCPACGEALIRRRGYVVEVTSGFREGRCPHCQTKIAGVWS